MKMKKIVMCAAIALISACLFAGVDFRTSTTGSYSVFRGSTAETETVVKSEYESKNVGIGLSVYAITPSLSYWIGMTGNITPVYSMDDESYSDYGENSTYFGEMWELNAGVGKKIDIAKNFDVLLGVGLSASRTKVQLEYPFLNVYGNYNLLMYNLGFSVKADFNYKLNSVTALMFGIDAFAHIYNITSSHNCIWPPKWERPLFNSRASQKGWALDKGIRISLGLTSCF